MSSDERRFFFRDAAATHIDDDPFPCPARLVLTSELLGLLNVATVRQTVAVLGIGCLTQLTGSMTMASTVGLVPADARVGRADLPRADGKSNEGENRRATRIST